MTCLKDKISCFRNELYVGEFSDNPDLIKTANQLKVTSLTIKSVKILSKLFFALNRITFHLAFFLSKMLFTLIIGTILVIVASSYFPFNRILNISSINTWFVNNREIIDWAKDNDLAIIESKKMEETQWIDLSIQLGYPYLYNHVGNCEHLVIFQNIKSAYF